MGLLGGSKKGNEIAGFVNEIRSARNRSALDAMESKLAQFEMKYTAAQLVPVYSELARKFYSMGEKDKAQFYATKGGARDILLKILSEEHKCEDMESIVKSEGAHSYAGAVARCYNESGRYEVLMRKYKSLFKVSKEPSVLYHALEAAIQTGMRDEVDSIMAQFESDFKGTPYYHAAKGRYKEFLGNYEEAVKSYEEALKTLKSDEIRYALAKVKYYSGDYAGAFKLVTHLPQHEPKVKALKSLLYAKDGKVNEALGIIDHVLREGNNVEALLAKALIMSEHGIGGYEDYLETVLYAEPYNPIALQLYARAIESKDRKKARETYERLLKISPNDYRALVGLARLSEGEERENYAKKALESNPNCSEAKIILAETMVKDNPDEALSLLEGIDDPRAHYLMGLAHLKLGNMDVAERHARLALDKERTNSKYKFLVAKIIAKSNREEAEELIRDVLKEDSKNEEARKLLAELIYKEHPEEALALLEGLDDYEAKWIRVRIYRILGRNEDAKRELDKIIKMGADVNTYLALAEVSEKDDAIEILNRVLKEHPDNERAKIMLARHLLDINPEESVKLLEGIDTNESRTIIALANYRLGNYEDSYPLLEECAVGNRECLKALVISGMKLGKYREVLKHAKDLVSRDDSLENLLLFAEINEHVDDSEAFEAYRKITLRYPENVDAWKKLIKYGEKTGKIVDNLEYYDRLYELTKDYNYLIKKAKYLEEIEDYEGLYDTYTRILAEHPELEEIEDKRDALLLQMGRYDDLIQLADYWISKRGAKSAKGYYLRALAYMNLGDLDNALDNINTATKRSRSAKYRQLKAEILYRMGRYDEAYEVIETISVKTQAMLLLKAKIFRAVKKYEEAEKMLKNLEKAGVREASKELGEMYVEMGREEEALKYLEDAARHFNDPEIYLIGVKLSYSIGNYKKAIWFINGGLKKKRNEKELWIYKVLSLLNMGDAEDALRAVERLVASDPKPEHHLLKAKVLNALGRFKEALDILEGLVEENVKEFYGVNPQEELAWALYNLGEFPRSIKIYRELGNADMVAANLYAMGRYKELMAMEEATPRVLEIKGDASLDRGKVEDAKNYYNLSMLKGNASARKKLADIFYKEGNLNGAYNLYSELDDEDSLLRSAEILEKLGQFVDSAKSYEEHFKRTGLRESGMKAVEIYKRMKRLEDAARVIEMIEDGIEIMKERARIYYEMGRYMDAVAVLQHIEEDDFDVYALMGDIYSAIDQPYRAREYYMKALALKEDKRIYKALAKVYERIGKLSDAADLYMKCDDEESFHRAERILREINNTPLLRKLYEQRLRKTVDIEAMKNLGEIYIKSGDYMRAKNIYEEVRDYEFSGEVLTKLGMINIELGNLNMAEKLLKQALELDELSETFYYLGKVYHLQKRYEEALDMYLKADMSGEMRKDLTRLYIDMGNVQKALEYGEMIVTEINDGESWYLYGLALMRGSFLDLALKAMKLAEEKGYQKLSSALGTIYFKLGQYERALKAVEDSDEELSKLILGLSYTRLGNLEKAKESFSELNTGDSLKYMGDLHLLSAAGNSERIVYPSSFTSLSNVDSAVQYYLEAMKKKLDFVNEKYLYNNLGTAYMLQGNHAKAAEMYEMSRVEPMNVLSAHVLLHEEEKAEELIDEMLDSYSKDLRYWNAKGVYYALGGKFDEAMECFTRADRLQGSAEDHETVIFNRALLLLKLGMYNSALELLSTIKIPDALILRTHVYITQGNYEEAKENLSKYRGSGEDDYLAFLHAYMEYKLGNYEGALKYINRALAKNPKRIASWSLKGMILSDMEWFKDAERSFRVANHLREDEKTIANLSAVLINMERYEEALNILKGAEGDIVRFNRACALARMGNTHEAEWEFKMHYKSKKDEKSLFYIYLSALMRGEPPVLDKESKELKSRFNLADLLLSSYNVKVIVKPVIDESKLKYEVTIKNLSGDTISPFNLKPHFETVMMGKVVGPIRPYDEETVVFRTTKSRRDLARENGLIPGEHVDITYTLYAHGVGVVEEITVKNLAKYAQEGVMLSPVLIEGFSAWKDSVVIDRLEPGEEKTVKFALLEDERLKTVREWHDKYGTFVPEFAEPEIMPESLSYKVILHVLPFELELPEEKIEYDVESATKLIKKERRRLLVKNVSKYTEAIVSVER